MFEKSQLDLLRPGLKKQLDFKRRLSLFYLAATFVLRQMLIGVFDNIDLLLSLDESKRRWKICDRPITYLVPYGE